MKLSPVENKPKLKVEWKLVYLAIIIFLSREIKYVGGRFITRHKSPRIGVNETSSNWRRGRWWKNIDTPWHVRGFRRGLV